MSWLACKPLVASIITGATRPEQVEANAGRGRLEAECRKRWRRWTG